MTKMLKLIVPIALLMAAPTFGAVSPDCQAALDAVGDSAQGIPASVIAACGQRQATAPAGGGGTPAYGWESVGADAATIGLTAPDVLTYLGTGGAPVGDFIGACDFGTDLNSLYCLSGSTAPTLFTVDVTTSAIGTVGVGATGNAQTPASLDFDVSTGVMYALTTDISAGSLYTVDLSNGALTLIGATSSACPIGGGFDNAGQGYYYDICDDSLYSYDKSNGSSAMIGALGFDANFGQGMDFDSDTDTCYLFAFNNGTFQPELRTCNVADGSTALVGVIGATSPGGLVQLGGAATQTGEFFVNPLEVPTVNGLGIAVLAFLLLGSSFVLMRRRRTV